jgi:hypothetical protein
MSLVMHGISVTPLMHRYAQFHDFIRTTDGGVRRTPLIRDRQLRSA